MEMKTGWYDVVYKINTELKSKEAKRLHETELILLEQTNNLIYLFKECEYVGFPFKEDEAQDFMNEVLQKVQNASKLNPDNYPNNPFFNLLVGLLHLENVLLLIKKGYESNLNKTIKTLEKAIYESEDFRVLIEASKNIGRKVINGEIHPDFRMLKQHIAEQLEYHERLVKFEPHTTSKKSIPEGPIMTIDQIALKLFYEGTQVTRENANQLIKEYGHKAGEKLYQRFTYYTSQANRRGRPVPDTKKKFKNKIELFEKVLENLSDDYNKLAFDELNILKNLYDSEYQ